MKTDLYRVHYSHQHTGRPVTTAGMSLDQAVEIVASVARLTGQTARVEKLDVARVATKRPPALPFAVLQTATA